MKENWKEATVEQKVLYEWRQAEDELRYRRECYLIGAKAENIDVNDDRSSNYSNVMSTWPRASSGRLLTLKGMYRLVVCGLVVGLVCGLVWFVCLCVCVFVCLCVCVFGCLLVCLFACRCM